MFPKVTPTQTAAWQQLQEHYKNEIKGKGRWKSNIDGKEPTFIERD